jgi:hypothetical protein
MASVVLLDGPYSGLLRGGHLGGGGGDSGVFGLGCKHPLRIAVNWTKKSGTIPEGNFRISK